MARRTSKKAESVKEKREKKKTSPEASMKVKNSGAGVNKARKPIQKKEDNLPDLRAVYSNNKHIFFPLGFATDFRTNKPMVIFSDMTTGQVHTVALSLWNRWKLKEVKKINTEV